jgi:hypothetical protein
MKAIYELIQYLRSHQALSASQLDLLDRHGFLPVDPDGDSDSEPPKQLPDDDEHVPPPEPRARRLGRVRRPHTLSARALVSEVDARTAEWDGLLDGLVPVGAELGADATWRAATVAIRKATPGELVRAFAHALRADRDYWPRLWDAVGFEGYRVPMNPKVLHGPAAASYRAILSATDVDFMRNHIWLLKFDPIRDVYNLRLAQRGLASAFGRLMILEPGLIASCQRRSFHPLGYWAGVVIHSARRHQQGGPDPRDIRSPRPLPNASCWELAWVCAALADPAAVVGLLPASVAVQQGTTGIDEALFACLEGRCFDSLRVFLARLCGGWSSAFLSDMHWHDGVGYRIHLTESEVKVVCDRMFDPLEWTLRGELTRTFGTSVPAFHGRGLGHDYLSAWIREVFAELTEASCVVFTHYAFSHPRGRAEWLSEHWPCEGASTLTRRWLNESGLLFPNCGNCCPSDWHN